MRSEIMSDISQLVPLYLQIRDTLRTEILEKNYQDGEAFFSEAALVARFNVARGTIRQALNTLEQDGFIRREKGRGTFVSKPSIATNKSDVITISFVVPHCRDSYVPTMLLGVEAAARERGAQVLFRHVESNPDLQTRVLEEARAYGASGILLFPVDSTYRDASLLKLIADDFPIVLVDRYVQGLDTSYVVTDGYGGTLAAVQHLAGLGHSRIGFLTWDVNRTGQAGRYLGYQQGLRESGMEPDSELVCLINKYPAEDFEPSKILEFLSKPTRPTAVIALNDYLAIQVMRACRELGLRVPRDLAIIGFDNIDTVAQMEIPLTTVAQPIHEIGAQATRMLLNKISGITQGTNRLVLSTHLVIRESCGGGLASMNRDKEHSKGAKRKE
jgi:GntR family transcriptional regulator of arabinose operon